MSYDLWDDAPDTPWSRCPRRPTLKSCHKRWRARRLRISWSKYQEIGISRDFTGFHGDFMGFHWILWDFMVISWDFTWLHGISWWFNGISWDLIMIWWWFSRYKSSKTENHLCIYVFCSSREFYGYHRYQPHMMEHFFFSGICESWRSAESSNDQNPWLIGYLRGFTGWCPIVS